MVKEKVDALGWSSLAVSVDDDADSGCWQLVLCKIRVLHLQIEAACFMPSHEHGGEDATHVPGSSFFYAKEDADVGGAMNTCD